MLSKCRIAKLLENYRKKESLLRRSERGIDMRLFLPLLLGANRYYHFIERRKKQILNRTFCENPDLRFPHLQSVK